MKPTPPGWPRLSSALYCDDPRQAIAWYCEAFGFEVVIVVDAPDGGVAHSEIRYGEAVVMVSQNSPGREARFGIAGRSPRALDGANTQSLFLYVDDVDAHCAQARAAGARVTYELTNNDYGADYWLDRTYGCLDPDGHLWWFSQRLRNPPARAGIHTSRPSHPAVTAPANALAMMPAREESSCPTPSLCPPRPMPPASCWRAPVAACPHRCACC